MNTIAIDRYLRIALLDFVLLIVVYFIPALSHLTAIPFYIMEPMRVVLFTSILLSSSKGNSYIMAVTLPLFSYFVAGHPIMIKNVIMAMELSANVFLLYKLMDKKVNLFLSCFLSIIASKVIYYILKFLAIRTGMLSLSLIDTSIAVQLIVGAAISLSFLLLYKKHPKA